jgi:hypothetical protein
VGGRFLSETHHMKEPDDLLGNVLAIRKHINDLSRVLDFRAHHLAPQDNVTGQVLSVRHELAELRATVDAIAERLGLDDAAVATDGAGPPA